DRAALPALEKALSDGDRAVRVEAARAVGRLGGPSSPTLPAGMLYSEDGVEIAGGLSAYGKGNAGVPIDRATQLLQTAAENDVATPVHIAVLDALGRRSDPPAVDLLAAQIKRGGIFRLRAIRALGVAQAADELLALPADAWSLDHLTASEYVMALAACEVEPATKKLSDLLGDPVRPRILSADERGFIALVHAASIARAKTFQDRLRDYLTDERELVRAVAADAAAKNANAADLEALVASLRMSRESKSSDAAVATIAALAEVAKKLEGADFARKRIADEVTPFVTDSRALVRAHAAALVGQITGRRIAAAFQNVASPLTVDDYERIARSLDNVTRMTVKTSRGDFTIECPNAAAPITTYRIARLADRGFYRDQIVHRVEPNFVVQSGDPLGSGWGGTGEPIRDEFARMSFTEMTVGLATAGPDTGESQWFVTHTATPHLDGAYTAFGRVTKGREVVLSLVPGDRVSAIEIEQWDGKAAE
ncbi:MAG: peptidylprolyl isomerase, partial [Deltaproteobacteria bacterium]|nr:peptidylprolyl isomerase [Deltaproteobacteria bacterium]